MAYELEGRISIQILFNSEEFMFQRANSLDFIHLSSTTRMSVPMLHMALQDTVDSLSESRHLSDASLIQLVITDASSKFSTTYAFRLNSYKRSPNNGGYRYEIDAYLDVSTYWHASTVVPVKGSSYNVMESIAKECGLTFSGDQTADSQVWFPRNIPYHEWARQVSERGYTSDKSFMQLGMCFDKCLVYKDLTKLTASQAKISFAEFREGYYTATDIQPVANSGTMNHFSGYAESLIEQDIQNKDHFKAHSKVAITKMASEGKMMVNANVKNGIKQARISFSPIDVGNTHENYERAIYQNRRQNNLFSVRLFVVIKTATKLKLLDKVSVDLDKADGYLKTYSGDYHLSSRTVFVQGNEYYEKLELVRKTMNSDLSDSVG